MPDAGRNGRNFIHEPNEFVRAADLLTFISLAPSAIPRYPRLVAQPFDILVRRGAARSHRVTALLDRLKESGSGPVRLRVVIQARLPRCQARPVQLEHQRITSLMIDCRTPEAADHARKTVLRAVQSLHRKSLSQSEEPEKVDLRSVPWEQLLNELDKRGITTVDFDSVPDAILRREFGRRLRKNRVARGTSEQKQGDFSGCESASSAPLGGICRS